MDTKNVIKILYTQTVFFTIIVKCTFSNPRRMSYNE